MELLSAGATRMISSTALYAQMSEWFKVFLCKRNVIKNNREFESLFVLYRIMEEKYEDSFPQEFKDKAKSLNLQITQLEFIELACKSFQERRKCDSNCIYLIFNLCNKT